MKLNSYANCEVSTREEVNTANPYTLTKTKQTNMSHLDINHSIGAIMPTMMG
jgi:hypothetical protein